jgi:2-hydroxychromene-2-carboxylate isomerase
VSVSWRAFLLGPIFAEQGWEDSPFNLYPAKGQYMWRDLERICETQGVPFRRPSEFPRSGLLAARVASRFSGSAWLPGFVRTVYRANFAEDLEISSEATIARCLAAASGEEPAALIAEAQSPAAKALLRARTEEAARLGIFGAPSFLVGGELFWGNDRLEDALSWAVTHPACCS